MNIDMNKCTTIHGAIALFLLGQVMSRHFNLAQAGVVMTGTRIIFPAQKTEKTLQFKNMDDFPNLMQVWVDAGDESSTPETAQSPFIIGPQIFKMAGQQGQISRLIFVGDAKQLPQDRESIYYLNFSEMPAVKQSDADKNKLLVVFKNRIKIFYRPEGLKGSADDVGDRLSYAIIGNATQPQLQLYNPSAFHANIAQMHIRFNGQKLESQDNLLIAPLSSIKLPIKALPAKQQALDIQVNLINDYGSSVLYSIKPHL